MAITAEEARKQILDELADAIDEIAVSVACLGDAFEQLAEEPGDRLEAELFRPLQKAYARGRRTHIGFAERTGLAKRAFELPSAGLPSQGVKVFIQRAVGASEDADRRVAELQDSMLPIESGDAELRAGLSEVRELLGGVPDAALSYLRTLGR